VTSPFSKSGKHGADGQFAAKGGIFTSHVFRSGFEIRIVDYEISLLRWRDE
jgi:hypothetical protein